MFEKEKKLEDLIELNIGYTKLGKDIDPELEYKIKLERHKEARLYQTKEFMQGMALIFFLCFLLIYTDGANPMFAVLSFIGMAVLIAYRFNLRKKKTYHHHGTVTHYGVIHTDDE